MTDQDYMHQTREQALRAWILGHMVKGAGWAAVLLFGTMFVIWLIYLFGLYVLPPETRQTPDPMPRSSIELVLPASPVA